jgi:parvulin-like peptidyl-prolyl isomerase
MMIRASHILVSSEDKINWIYKELQNGRDFAKLAKDYSMCPSKERGGDLGFFNKGQMVKEFDDVAFKMKEGDISKPIKTQFGYHVIKLTGKK